MASGNGFSDRIAHAVPLFTSRVDDEYAEVFRSFCGGQKVPAVPFLEFSTVCHGGIAEISGDSYSDIFGGFGWDLAVSLDELLGGLKAAAEKKDAGNKSRGNGEKKSLQKVPTKLNFPVENSEDFLFYNSENISVTSNSASQELHDIEKLLDKSYMIMNPTSKENCMSGTHVAEVASVSEFASAVNAYFSLESHNIETGGNIVYNMYSGSDVTGEIRDIEPTTTTLSYNNKSGSCLLHMHGNDGKEDIRNIHTESHHVENVPSTCINSRSYASFHELGVDECDLNEVYLTVSEINLQTQPTQLPPPLRKPPKLDIKQESKKMLGSSTRDCCENDNMHNLMNCSGRNYKTTTSETCVVEDALRPTLLPCLDVEIDENSATAASTTALKEVMDEAKTKLRIVKESKERRRDTRDGNKKLEAREEKRNKEHKECEVAQEFFKCTAQIAPEEIKNYGQKNKHGKMTHPKEVSEAQEVLRSFYPAQECVEEKLKGSNAVKGFDWQDMKKILKDCNKKEEQKGMMPSEEVFELQGGETRSCLVQNNGEERVEKGSSRVLELHRQEMEKRKYKLKEAQRWEIDAKALNAAAIAYERKENGKNLTKVQKVHHEENIRKWETTELCEQAGQEVQVQEEKERHFSEKDRERNERVKKLAAAWEAAALKENVCRLKTVRASRKQEQIHHSRQSLTKELAEQEETISLRMDHKAHKHEKGEKLFKIFQDDNEAIREGQNVAQAVPIVDIENREKGMSQHVINKDQGTRQKMKNVIETCEIEEKEKVRLEKERLKGEQKQEIERLRRVDEDMDYKRDKQGNTVEQATQNADDEVVVEVWGRAQRAAVSRTTAKIQETVACEKAEDAQAESCDTSPDEKASRGAMFETVEAAWDSASTEDWERAVERAMIEEPATESTKYMERAVAEMIAGSVKESDDEPDLCDGTGMRMNNVRHNSMSDIQNFSYGVSFEVETEKRRKARLERCKRTQDRVAKALAEKKARDTLAEKEQAERHRLAEALDCDIKRWSNGKEGNLRALLSTLQYILWPESGWNPIPLTEVITSAAVKKAYRKATLCVHPDKVQQRGASIQQKYISEKVFDLLKEAWNNFNSEER